MGIEDELWSALAIWCDGPPPAAAARPERHPRDGCVVLTGPLADLVGGFVAVWNAERPSTGGQFASADTRTEVVPVSAVRWLAQETGVPEDTIGNIVRRRHRHTELRIADALVTALGRPEAFWDGTLAAFENPQAPAAVLERVRRDGGCACA